MSLNIESQVGLARRLYSARARDYEESWHPQYTARFMSLVDIKPGDRVLCLACGTGLEIDIAAPQVGEEGLVVGVDVTAEMLDVAKRKLDKTNLDGRVNLIQHDVTNLQTCKELENESFDWILCSSAFVLFHEPAAVVKLWKGYLRPGARMVIDITHEYNLRSGTILEHVATRIGAPFPYKRSWNTSRDSFKKILEGEGLAVEQVQELEKEPGKSKTYYDVTEADAQFDNVTQYPMMSTTAYEDFLQKARPVFVEEWNAAAVDGKVLDVNSVYVYIARKSL